VYGVEEDYGGKEAEENDRPLMHDDAAGEL
jgi:hypothetical protein